MRRSARSASSDRRRMLPSRRRCWWAYSTKCVQEGIEGQAWTHDRGALGAIRMVVAADINRLALRRVQLVDDPRLVARQLLGERPKAPLQHRIGALRGERLRPVERQIEMAAATVQLTHVARGRSVVFEY